MLGSAPGAEAGAEPGERLLGRLARFCPGGRGSLFGEIEALLEAGEALTASWEGVMGVGVCGCPEAGPSLQSQLLK